MPEHDKATRPYNSDLRRRQAADTRRRVVEAAVVLFEQRGYRATTFAQLAAEAGVSVKTVQEHGPKSALLQAAVELASFGVEGETDFFATDLGQAMLQVESVDELARMIGSAMLTINTPSARLWMTFVSAAHADQELGRYHARMLSLIRAQVEHVLKYIDARGWLRRDVPLADLVEAFCIITCIETYVRFVMYDGMPLARYEDFVSRTVRETILAQTETPAPGATQEARSEPR